MNEIRSKSICLVCPTFTPPNADRGNLSNMTLDDFADRIKDQIKIGVGKILYRDYKKNYGLVAFIPFQATSPYYTCIASFPLMESIHFPQTIDEHSDPNRFIEYINKTITIIKDVGNLSSVSVTQHVRYNQYTNIAVNGSFGFPQTHIHIEGLNNEPLAGFHNPTSKSLKDLNILREFHDPLVLIMVDFIKHFYPKSEWNSKIQSFIISDHDGDQITTADLNLVKNILENWKLIYREFASCLNISDVEKRNFDLDKLQEKYSFLTPRSRRMLKSLSNLIKPQSINTGSILNQDIRGAWGILVDDKSTQIRFSPRAYRTTEESLSLFSDSTSFFSIKDRGANPIEGKEFTKRIKCYKSIIDRI